LGQTFSQTPDMQEQFL